MFAQRIREEVLREGCRVLGLSQEDARLAMFAGSASAGIAIMDRHAGSSGTLCTIVVDNTHTVPSDDLIDLVRATANIRWIFLLHPIQSLDEFCAMLRVRPEWLHGWSAISIARHCRSADLSVSALDIARLLELTGGIPLFVLNIIDISRNHPSLAETIADIQASVSEALPLQEIMARRILEAMDDPTRIIAALLALAQMEMSHSEWLAVFDSMELATKAVATKAILHLRNIGVISFGRTQPVRLHDSFTATVMASCERIEPHIKRRFFESLFALLSALELRWSHDAFERRRFVRWVTVMPFAGQTDLYSDIVPELAELVIDQPEQWLLIQALQDLLSKEDLSLEHRFWTLQPLAFLHMDTATVRQAGAYLASMRSVVASMELPEVNVLSAIAHLDLQFQSLVGKEEDVRRAYARGREILMEDFRRRIWDFTFARQLMNFDRYADARALLDQLRREYLQVVGLSVRDLMKGPSELTRAVDEAMNGEIDTMAIKHLADVLRSLAVCEERLKRAPQYEMIHAAKLYEGARFAPGEIAVGFALIEASLNYLGIPEFALSQSDFLLQKARESGWHEESLAIQRLRIEALLQLGENDRASAALGELTPFITPGTPLATFVRATSEVLGQPRTVPQVRGPAFPPSEYSTMVATIMLAQHLVRNT